MVGKISGWFARDVIVIFSKGMSTGVVLFRLFWTKASERATGKVIGVSWERHKAGVVCR